jgi:plasmid stability protein
MLAAIGCFSTMKSEVVPMARFLIRNLSDELVARLKQRAEARGVSREAEVREILHSVANEPTLPAEPAGERAGTKLARELAKIPYDEETWKEFESNLAEVRVGRMRTVDFDK